MHTLYKLIYKIKAISQKIEEIPDKTFFNSINSKINNHNIILSNNNINNNIIIQHFQHNSEIKKKEKL